MAAEPQQPQPGPVQRRRKTRGVFPPEIVELILPSARIGAYTGTLLRSASPQLLTEAFAYTHAYHIGGLGAFAGVARSIVSDVNPLQGGIVAGIQWFALGSTYFCETRSLALSLVRCAHID